jgi:hypothetical protein
MVMLKTRLQERKKAIHERWLEKTFSTYARDTSAFLSRVKDPFGNPVGETLRNGTAGILDCLLDGMDPDAICGHLDGIIRIRAVQEFSPSRAVSFVFELKEAIREEIGEPVPDEIHELEKEIDQIALFAFDVHLRCREQVYELRVSEVKRNVEGLLRRFGDRGADL